MKEPHKWWMVIPGPIDRTTGGTIYDRRMVEAAHAVGDQVTVVSLPGKFPRSLSEVDLQACRTALETVPDRATVCVDGLVLPSLSAELQSFAERCRLVTLIHHPTSLEPGLPASEREALWRAESAVINSAQRIICTSAYTARVLAERGVSPKTLSVVAPGVDLPRPTHDSRETHPRSTHDRGAAHSGGGGAHTQPAPPGAARPTRMLCVANLMQRKGLDYLIEALGQLRELNWAVTLVGSAEFEPRTAARLRQMVCARELESRVAFVGAQSEPDLDRLYREADIFVFPSLYEGYGMVLTEAAAHGLPIIATDGGAVPDTVAGLGADIVAAGDAEALADAMARFLTDPAHRARLAERSRTGRSRLQSWESVADSFRHRLLEPVAGELTAATSAAIEAAAFDMEWLNLRELADHRFRSRELVQLADRLLGQRSRTRVAGGPGGSAGDSPADSVPAAILDLASGSGSNMRFVAPLLNGPQRWLLCDVDAALLDCAIGGSAGAMEAQGNANRLTATSRVIDLARVIPMQADGRTPDLVTASALLDLVSDDWLARLVERFSDADPAPLFLAATVYNGDVRFSPQDPEDEAVLAAFQADMRRDKGFGPALGDRAPAAAEMLLSRRGFHIIMRDSTWRLDEDLSAAIGSHRFTELCRRQLQFFADAAGTDARGWLQRRLAQLRSRRLQILIGHCDLLAAGTCAGDLEEG